MLFAFVSGHRWRGRLSERQVIFVRSFIGGLALWGIPSALLALRFWLVPDLPPLKWAGLCLSLYVLLVLADVARWWFEPETQIAFEAGTRPTKRELMRLYWFAGSATISAWVSGPPERDVRVILVPILLLALIGLVAFGNAFGCGRVISIPGGPRRPASGDASD